MGSIDVPPDVYEVLNVPEERRTKMLQQELAVSPYREDTLSFGKAKELTQISHRGFHRLLGEREVDRHYTSEELEEDVEYARG